jgi:alanine dehydrogenase
MIIGVPKEIKNNENRVGLTPAGAYVLASHGHTVLVEQGAGAGSSFTDQDYVAAGGIILEEKRELFDQAEMIIKVKEPLASEYDLFHAGQILYTYLHLAPEPALTAALLERKVVGIAYETIEDEKHTLPLLAPMSEVAGRMAVQVGARILEKQAGGKGILLSGVPGVAPGSVLVDVAIDQGGCIETVDHVTTHSEPTYVKFGVVHYAVANIPGAVPRTSTLALTNATLPYAVQLADRGWQKACAADAGLAAGLNVVWGHVTYRAVATALQLPYLPWQEAGLDA